MDSLLIYLFKVALATTLLYICYILFFNRDTFYSRNRILLILIILLPFVLPAIKIPVVSESSIPAGTTAVLEKMLFPDTSATTGITPEIAKTIDYLSLFAVICFVISGIILLRCVISIVVTLRIIAGGVVMNNQFPKIVITAQKLSPFSFFPYIVIPAEYENSENYADIINHEAAHVRQGHTFDLLAGEIMIALQWFNPFAWLIKRSIILNHEYLADNVSISRHNDIKEYQMGLLKVNSGLKTIPFVHSFNSVVKNRIIMINKKPSPAISTLKNFLILPVVALVTFASGTPEYKYLPSEHSPITSEQDVPGQAKGIVLGEDGQPLKLVTVIMRSSTPENIGVQTGTNGRFVINNLLKDATLEFTCIGYKTQILKPDFKADMIVRMEKDPNYKGTVRTPVATYYHEGANVRVVVQNKETAIAIDDKLTGSLGEITLKRDDIAFSKILNGAEALEKYGDKGKSGVLEIVTKKHAEKTGYKPPEIQMSTNNPGDFPTFQGEDRRAFNDWVLKNVNYPEEASRKGIEGWVSVTFTVNPDGTVSNVVSTMPVDKLLSDEVIRVVKSSPRWDIPKNGNTIKPYSSNVTIKFFSKGKSGEAPLNKVDEMPEYPGGEKALLDFIKNNIRYPENLLAEKVQGSVIIRFIVTKEGNTEGISVIKGIHPLLDAEAVRVAGLLKGWEPARLDGKPVNTWYMLPVSFKVD